MLLALLAKAEKKLSRLKRCVLLKQVFIHPSHEGGHTFDFLMDGEPIIIWEKNDDDLEHTTLSVITTNNIFTFFFIFSFFLSPEIHTTFDMNNQLPSPVASSLLCLCSCTVYLSVSAEPSVPYLQQRFNINNSPPQSVWKALNFLPAVL